MNGLITRPRSTGSGTGEGGVTSVNGRTGAITLTTSDVGGLGSIATQNANAVTITGGMISGLTSLGAAAATLSGLLSFTGTGHAGLQLNSLTTTQRDAIATPSAGMLLWNSTQTRVNVHNGTAWTDGFVRLAGDTMTAPLIVPGGSLAAPGLAFANGTNSGFAALYAGQVYVVSSGVAVCKWAGGMQQFGRNSLQGLAWSPAIDAGQDTWFKSSAAGTFDFFGSTSGGNPGASPTTLFIYGAYTDASNYERLVIKSNTGGTAYEDIYTEYAGTGNSLGLGLGHAGARRWFINAGGLYAQIDNTYDIGSSGANRPRNLYVGTGIYAGGEILAGGSHSAGIAASGFFRMMENRGYFTAAADGVFSLYNAATTDFGRLQFGGTTAIFPSLKRSAAVIQGRLADDSAFCALQGKLTTDTNYTAGDPTTTGYLTLYDAAGTAYKVPAVAS